MALRLPLKVCLRTDLGVRLWWQYFYVTTSNKKDDSLYNKFDTMSISELLDKSGG